MKKKKQKKKKKEEFDHSAGPIFVFVCNTADLLSHTPYS